MHESREQIVQTPSDADLVVSARRGDSVSLGLLLERHRARLFAAALWLLGYGPDAEDAVHDTFLVALQRLGDLRDPRAVGAWLHSVLRRSCLQHLRQRRPEVVTAVVPEPVEPGSSVQDRLERLAMRDWVWGALQKLSEPVRATAMLRYFGSYESYEEIAAILAIPVGTARSRLSEAKVKLADALLATAGLADDGTRALAGERQRFYTEAFHDLFGRGERDRFLDHYANDLQVFWSSGRSARGREHLAAEIDEDLEAHVRLHPQRVLSSGRITVIEGRFENPPDDPHHCPPGLAMVAFLTDDKTSRVHLHLSARPPQAEAE